MRGVQSWPRAVRRPYSQEKGGLRAQKGGPGAWGTGSEKASQRRGSLGGKQTRCGMSPGKGKVVVGGCWQSPGGHVC